MTFEDIETILNTLAKENLLLIDNGETLEECEIEVRHKNRKTDNKEVYLFIVKNRA